MTLYPLCFRPILKERIWGGRRLAAVLGRSLPEGKKIGESWDLVDLNPDISVVEEGPLEGISLHQLLLSETQGLLGEEQPKLPSFPLLIKTLDCEDVLSVQVHPDPKACERLGKGKPKTEAWYILASEPGAYIYKGLVPGVTKAAFATALKAGRVAELLQKVNVKEGECHFIPAGTPHAIGPGLLISEIQTASDTTYRVFDWNRVDERGQSRELHLGEALASINFEADAQGLTATTEGRLVDCPYFKIDKIKIDELAYHLPQGRLKIIICLKQPVTIISPNYTCHLSYGQLCLGPACLEVELKPQHKDSRPEVLVVSL